MRTASDPPSRDARATRAAILAAARERFANDGYERATIRAIAADAGIDAALVMRYFGNKEGLFSAAAEFDLRLPDLSAIPDAELGMALAAHFIARWDSGDTFRALLRAAVTHEAAVARMHDILNLQLTPALAARLRDPATASVRAALLTSHLLGFALGRRILRFDALVGLSAAQVERLLGDVFQRVLFDPLPQ